MKVRVRRNTDVKLSSEETFGLAAQLMLQTNDLGNVSSRTHTRKEWQLLKRLAATSSPIFLSLYVDVSVHGE